MRFRSPAGAAALATMAFAALTACHGAGNGKPDAHAIDASSAPRPIDVVAALDATAAAVPDAAARPRDTHWSVLGNGVGVRDLAEPRGEALFIGLAGWRITDASTRAWVDALTNARLHPLGVGRVYAVRGPAAVDNRSHDLAVSDLIDDVLAHTTPSTRTVLIAAHSSGQLVATEIFHRLFVTRADHGDALRDRILFVSLDGDADVPDDPTRRLAPETVGPLRRAWFVTAIDARRGIAALSNATMRMQQQRYRDRSTFLEFDASDAGCTTTMCVHLSLIHRHPLPRGNASYASFGDEGPNVFWIDALSGSWR